MLVVFVSSFDNESAAVSPRQRDNVPFDSHMGIARRYVCVSQMEVM